MITSLPDVLSDLRSAEYFAKPWHMVPHKANLFKQNLTDGAISKHYCLGLCLHWVWGWSTGKFCVHTYELKAKTSNGSLSRRWFKWPSVNVTLAISGHLGVQNVCRGRVGKRPLCRSQVNSKNARVSQKIDRKGRWPLTPFQLYLCMIKRNLLRMPEYALLLVPGL